MRRRQTETTGYMQGGSFAVTGALFVSDQDQNPLWPRRVVNGDGRTETTDDSHKRQVMRKQILPAASLVLKPTVNSLDFVEELSKDSGSFKLQRSSV